MGHQDEFGIPGDALDQHRERDVCMKYSLSPAFLPAAAELQVDWGVPGEGYIALELLFVSARTNQRQHHQDSVDLNPNHGPYCTA